MADRNAGLLSPLSLFSPPRPLLPLPSISSPFAVAAAPQHPHRSPPIRSLPRLPPSSGDSGHTTTPVVVGSRGLAAGGDGGDRGVTLPVFTDVLRRVLHGDEGGGVLGGGGSGGCGGGGDCVDVFGGGGDCVDVFGGGGGCVVDFGGGCGGFGGGVVHGIGQRSGGGCVGGGVGRGLGVGIGGGGGGSLRAGVRADALAAEGSALGAVGRLGGACDGGVGWGGGVGDDGVGALASLWSAGLGLGGRAPRVCRRDSSRAPPPPRPPLTRPPPRYSFVDAVGRCGSGAAVGATFTSPRLDASVGVRPLSCRALADAVALVALAVVDSSLLGPRGGAPHFADPASPSSSSAPPAQYFKMPAIGTHNLENWMS